MMRVLPSDLALARGTPLKASMKILRRKSGEENLNVLGPTVFDSLSDCV